MALRLTSIRVNKNLADEAKKLLGAKSRTEAARLALEEIVGHRRFKQLMLKNAGQLRFLGSTE